MRLPDRLAIAHVRKQARKIVADGAEFAGALAFYLLEAAAKAASPTTATRFAKLVPELEELLDAIALAGEEKGGEA